MRISKIEINNFRGLYGQHKINLTHSGKNLMIYGENGSGKSSFCHALKVFFEASIKETSIAQHKNIFVQGNPDDDVHIKVTFNDNGTLAEIILDKDNKKNPQSFLIEANKIKGFLGYKNLLRTHYIDGGKVNLFDLLINDLFVYTPDPVTGNADITKRWLLLQYNIRKKRHTPEYKSCTGILNDLNQSIKTLLTQVESKANEIIQQFDYNVKIRFHFPGISMIESQRIKDRGFENKNIYLSVDFFDKPAIDRHHYFLNESRLTAIAISIYFASILIMPQQTLYKILVLDDILVGLDTSNRLPLLEILKKYFVDYQIIMATHDRQWYEVVNSFLGKSDWVYYEMYVKKQHQNGYEIPVLKNGDFIQIAKDYLTQGDLKASAVYIRSEFERILIKYCDEHRCSVQFQIKSEKVPIESFWKSVKIFDSEESARKIVQPKLDTSAITQVESLRTLVMNPFSHYDLMKPQFRAELQATISIVEQLKTKLSEKYVV